MPSAKELERIVDSRTSILLAARRPSTGDGIVGILTLVVFPLPTGTRASIEDLVVDTASRGHGAGEALCREALRIAEREGARVVDLTSNSKREAAHRLYRRLGFVLRETNVYQLRL